MTDTLRHPLRPRRARARTRATARHPRDPPDLDLRAGRAGRVRRRLRLLALGQPDARRARARAGELEGGLGQRVLLRHGRRARADHRRLRRRRSRRHPRRPLRRHLPARRQGALALGPRVHDGRPDRPRRGRARRPRRHQARLGRDADQPDAEGRRHRRRRRAHAATRSSRSTTRSPRRSTSARWSSAPTPSCTRPRSTSAGTPTPSAAPSIVARPGAARRCASCRTRSAPCPGRSTASSCTAACARCTCGWPRTPRTRAWSSSGWRASTGIYEVRWPGFSRHGLLPAPRGARDRRRDEALLARRVAGRGRVADRGPAGDDAPVRRGLRARPFRPTSCGSRAGSRRRRTWSRTSRRRSAGVTQVASESRRWVLGGNLYVLKRGRAILGGCAGSPWRPRPPASPRSAAATSRSAPPARTARAGRRGRRVVADRATPTSEDAVSLPPLPQALAARSASSRSRARASRTADEAAADPGLSTHRRASRPRAASAAVRGKNPASGGANAVDTAVALGQRRRAAAAGGARGRQADHRGRQRHRAHALHVGRRARQVAGHGLRLLGLGLVRAGRRGPAGRAAGLRSADVLGRAGQGQVGHDLGQRRATSSSRWRASASTPPPSASPARAGSTRCAPRQASWRGIPPGL